MHQNYICTPTISIRLIKNKSGKNSQRLDSRAALSALIIIENTALKFQRKIAFNWDLVNKLILADFFKREHGLLTLWLIKRQKGV